MKSSGKKKKTLSNLDKALMASYQCPNPSIEYLKEFREHVESSYQEAATTFGTFGSPGVPVERTAAQQDIIKRIMKDTGYLASYARALILGYWNKHRIVYHIPKETLSFLENDFKIEYWKANYSDVMESVCSEPIFIEVDGEKGFYGFFAGQIAAKGLELGAHAFTDALLFTSIAIQDNAWVGLRSCIDTLSFAEAIEHTPNQERDDDGNKKAVLVDKLLGYIGFLKQMGDAKGTALIKDRSKSYLRYSVLPIPFKDSLPDFSVPGGWIASGLCYYFGLLNREHMISDIKKELETHNDWDSMPLSVKDRRLDTPDEVVFYHIKKSVLQWENQKVVYSYTTDVAQKLDERYSINDSTLVRVPSQLIKYMPYNTIVLSQVDTGSVTMVSKCNVLNNGILNEQLLITHLTASTKMYIIIVPTDMGVCISSENIEDASNAILDTIAVIRHILTIYQKKAEKRYLKSLLETGTEGSKALIPVEEYTQHRKRETPDTDKDSSLRFGAPISDEPFELNEVTARTVKRIPTAQAEKQVGWTMRPHSRRAHPHRYWVGKGPEKHMEVRYLGEMRIHSKDKPLKGTVIHKIDVHGTDKENALS